MQYSRRLFSHHTQNQPRHESKFIHTGKTYQKKHKNPSFSKVTSYISRSVKSYKYDWSLIIIIFGLLLYGLTFLSSALSSTSLQNYGVEFAKQLIFAMWIGGGICFFLSRIDYHFWLKQSYTLYLITLIPLLYIAVFIGISNISGLPPADLISKLGPFPIKPYFSKGAIRWISITFLPTIQPAEFAKLFLLLFVSNSLYQKLLKKAGETKQAIENTFLQLRDIWHELTYIGIVYLLILIQPDLGSIIISSAILGVAMWVSNVHPKLLLHSALILILVGIISILALSYRSQRVATFIDFYTDPVAACSGSRGQGSNLQVCQIRRFITEGGLFGKGFGQSEATKNSYIPEITTDSILAVIGEETGFVGIFLLLLLYFLIFIKGIQIAWNAPDTAGKSIACGIAIWMLTQAVINIAGVTGLLPLKGAPLPFVSEGGSAIVLNLMSMGILINISAQRITKHE